MNRMLVLDHISEAPRLNIASRRTWAYHYLGTNEIYADIYFFLPRDPSKIRKLLPLCMSRKLGLADWLKELNLVDNDFIITDASITSVSLPIFLVKVSPCFVDICASLKPSSAELQRVHIRKIQLCIAPFLGSGLDASISLYR